MMTKLKTFPWQKNYKMKEEYASGIKESIDIEIDINKIADNPGKFAMAKICLNSMWGKFSHRINMNRTTTDPCEFYCSTVIH